MKKSRKSGAATQRAGKRQEPARDTGAATRPTTVADLGWSRVKAAEIRASLLAFEEDWNAPGMEAYDKL